MAVRRSIARKSTTHHVETGKHYQLVTSPLSYAKRLAQKHAQTTPNKKVQDEA